MSEHETPPVGEDATTRAVMGILAWSSAAFFVLGGVLLAGLPLYAIVSGDDRLAAFGKSIDMDGDWGSYAAGIVVGLLLVAAGIAMVSGELPGRRAEPLRPGDADAVAAIPAAVPSAGPAGGREQLRVTAANGFGFVAFDPPGRRLVTSGADGTRVWDVADGRLLQHVARARGAVSLSPDGERLVTTNGLHGLVVLAVEDGRELLAIAHRRRPLSGGFGVVEAVAFSPDGRLFASASDPDTRVWSVADGAEVLRIAVGPREFETVYVAFSGDGRHIVTSRSGDPVHVWGAEDGRLVRKLVAGPRGTKGPTGVASSPDGTLLAVLCGDGSASVWEIDSGVEVLRIDPGERVRCIDACAPAWSADARRLAVPNVDGSTSVWDLARDEELVRVRDDEPPLRPGRAERAGDAMFGRACFRAAVALSRDGTMLATAGQAETARVWAV